MSLRRKPADGQQRKLPPCVSAIKTALADSRRVGHLVLCPQSVRAHALLGKKKAAGGTDGLCISMVEQRLLTANTIYANSVEIKVTRNWFAVVTFCESNNKKG